MPSPSPNRSKSKASAAAGRKPLEVITSNPKFGAGKEQQAINATMRDMRNRTYIAESDAEKLKIKLATAERMITTYRQRIDAMASPPVDAIAKIARMTVGDAIYLGLVSSVEELIRWRDALSRIGGEMHYAEPASGKAEA